MQGENRNIVLALHQLHRRGITGVDLEKPGRAIGCRDEVDPIDADQAERLGKRNRKCLSGLTENRLVLEEGRPATEQTSAVAKSGRAECALTNQLPREAQRDHSTPVGNECDRSRHAVYLLLEIHGPGEGSASMPATKPLVGTAAAGVAPPD